MPLRPPALDDRSYDDLVAELIARIPAHTPEWTHVRPGDPGRTLIELFAWLGDTILYRANRVPERQRLAFLRLLGMPLEPAVAATGLVGLDVADDRNPKAQDIPADAVIEKPVPFSTRQFVTAYPLAGRVFVKRQPDEDESARFESLLPDLAQVYRLTTDARVRAYVTTEVFEGGAMNPAGVDIVAGSVDRSLWIALMAPSAKSREAAKAQLAPQPNGLPRAINVGLALACEIPGLDEKLGSRARVPMHWEISSGNSTGGAGDMLNLDVLADSTGDLARHGVVRLALPDPAFIGAPPNDPRDNLMAGVGDAPPRLDNPDDAARLVAWLRLRPRPGVTVESLKLSWVGINAVEIEQRETLPPRALGVSDAGSDQSFSLGVAARGSVDPRTLAVRVLDPITGDADWKPVDDLGAAGPLEPVYRLDPEAGTVTFGDGVHGRVPSAGSQIVARGLRVGGGRQGNLPPRSLATLDSRPDPLTGQRGRPAGAVKVVQALPTQGGHDSETLQGAERRIPGHFRHRDRAVTAEDYRALAREAPGVEVGRVELLPRFEPHRREGNIPGVVSVMVLPRVASIDLAPPYPRADRPLLETVHAFLDARRPLATELYVIGCAYRELGVSVAVQIRDGHAREAVLLGVRQALRAYLWPLPLGDDGPWPETRRADGGYPLGRSVTDRELEVVAARVAGVAGVSPVRLFERVDGAFVELPGAGKVVTTLDLEDWELPELTGLVVVEGADAPASIVSPFGTGQGAGGGTEVAVPVVAETC